MNDIIDRLAGVESDDLPPVPLSSVRRRASRQRDGQRLAAGGALAVLLVGLAMGVPLLIPSGGDVADAPATSDSAVATKAPDTAEATAMADEPAGTLAVWVLTDPGAVTAETTRLDLLVTRVECASAFTGEVLPAQVTMTDDAVSIRAEVERLDPGQGGECPSNPYVPISVDLPEPIGDRTLIDEGCANGEFARTSHCEDDGVRWQP